MTDIPEDDRASPRPPPHVVTTQFVSPWNIATPAVYRYEDEEWIEKFCQTGLLRLSTFAKFASYPDEIRGDTEEGRGLCIGDMPDGNSFGTFQSTGFTTAVLCGSHRLGRDLKEVFKRNSAFEITNTTRFALEISRQLAGFQHGLEGSCIYRPASIIHRVVDFDFESFKIPGGGVSLDKMLEAGQPLGGPELFLLKRKLYEAQQEYRLLWHLDAIDADHVDVIAPLARQFCRRLDAEDWGE